MPFKGSFCRIGLQRFGHLKTSLPLYVPPFTVKREEEYIASNYRPKKDGTVKTWNYKLKGPARGTWDVSYGFTFGINAINEEQSYHLAGADSSYTIMISGSSDLMNLTRISHNQISW